MKTDLRPHCACAAYWLIRGKYLEDKGFRTDVVAYILCSGVCKDKAELARIASPMFALRRQLD